MLPEEMVHGGIYEVTNTKTGDFCVGYFDYFKQHKSHTNGFVVMKDTIAHYNHLYDGHWNAVHYNKEFKNDSLKVRQLGKYEEQAYHAVITAIKAFYLTQEKNG